MGGGGLMFGPERADSGLISLEQCAGALRRTDSGIVRIKRSKSLLLRERCHLSFFWGLQEVLLHSP